MPNRASSGVRPVLLAGCMIMVMAPAVAAQASTRAQDSLRARLDSLAARVERAEEQVKVLQEQLATEAQSAVKTHSRVALEFRGRVLMNAFINTRRVNSTGNPQFVRPDDPGDPQPRGLAMHMRQTSLGMGISAPHVWGATFVGDIDVDFHGGQLPSSGGRTFPLIRLRTARGMLQWKRAELLMGQESPLTGGVNPVSLAALGIPDFVAAGNLWLWLPQIRGSYDLTGGKLRLGVQAAVLAPGTAASVGVFDVPDFDVAEKSNRPFLEGRARLRWGEDENAGEIGFGGHLGWYATALDTLVRGFATVVDAVVPFAGKFEVRGEAYDGRGTRSLGGGAVGQLFGVDATLIRSRGGWAQLNVRPVSSLTVGGGWGMDDPHDADLAANSRLRNESWAVHSEWRPAGPLVFGTEFRRIRTHYVPRAFTNDHLNFSVGWEF